MKRVEPLNRTLRLEDGIAAVFIALFLGPFLAKLAIFIAWANLGDAPGFLDARLGVLSMAPGDVVSILLLWLLVLWKAPMRVRAVDATGIGVARPTGRWGLETLIAFVAVVSVASAAGALALYFGVDISGAGAVETAFATVGGLERAALIASVVLLAPAAEEFAYRGVLLGAVATRFGASAAVVVTTLVFILVHVPAVGSPVGLAGILALGAATALLRFRSGSLLPAILLHAAWNGFGGATTGLF